MNQIDSILSLISGAARIAGAAGVPIAGLVANLIPIANEFIDSIAAQTGKTRDEIIADTGVVFDEELTALMASAAKGE